MVHFFNNKNKNAFCCKMRIPSMSVFPYNHIKLLFLHFLKLKLEYCKWIDANQLNSPLFLVIGRVD